MNQKARAALDECQALPRPQQVPPAVLRRNLKTMRASAKNGSFDVSAARGFLIHAEGSLSQLPDSCGGRHELRPIPAPRAFTLIELLLVMSIIALLLTITMPLFGMLRAKAGGAVCISNLRTLHTAFNLYLQDHNGVWPQYPSKDGFTSEVDEWRFWADTMKEYGVGRKHWICPTDGDTIRADQKKRNDDFLGSYSVTPFDENPGSALKWKTPWIIERGSFHGDSDGPNMLMPDGTIQQGLPMPPIPKGARSAGGG